MGHARGHRHHEFSLLVDLEDAPDVVAVVITLGASSRLAACLASVAASKTEARLAILCVVNGYDDLVQDNAFPISIRRTNLNLGWSGGITYARTQFESDFLWLIQDDMTVSPGCLDGLLTGLTADERLGALSPLAIDESGLVRAASCGGVLDSAGRMDYWYPPEPTQVQDLCEPFNLSYVRSSGLLLRTAAYDQVGGWDVRFFPVLWGDVDLCWRLACAGWAFRNGSELEGVSICHPGNGSTPTLLGEFLSDRNCEMFRAKSGFDSTATRSMSTTGSAKAVADSVPQQLVHDVAQSSTDVLLDFSRFANRRTRELSDQHRAAHEAYGNLQEHLAGVAAANAGLELRRAELAGEVRRLRSQLKVVKKQLREIKTSRSWTLTKPFRAVSKKVKR